MCRSSLFKWKVLQSQYVSVAQGLGAKLQDTQNLPWYGNHLFLKELPERPLATIGLRGEVTSHRDLGGLSGSSWVSLKGGSCMK